MKNKKDINHDFFSNQGLGVGFKEFLDCEASAFAKNNGFSSVKGLTQWLTAEISLAIGGFFSHTNAQGVSADLKNQREGLKASLQELDKYKVLKGDRQPISQDKVFAKYFNQVVKNAPVYLKDNPSAQVRSLEELGLTPNNNVQVDSQGNFVITVLANGKNYENINLTNNQLGNNATIKGDFALMGENLKKYEELYKNNVLAFKSDLDSFFSENSQKLKSDLGKNELADELMRSPLKRIEDLQERKAYSKCFVDDYAKNVQNNANSFTHSGCELVAAKYTKEQIEKDPKLHAYENGKITNDYAQFTKDNCDRASQNNKTLENGVLAQGRDPSFKEKATYRANQQIQKNWDVGSYQNKNLTQEHSSNNQNSSNKNQEENNVKR